jgi:hypothetical protein
MGGEQKESGWTLLRRRCRTSESLAHGYGERKTSRSEGRVAPAGQSRQNKSPRESLDLSPGGHGDFDGDYFPAKNDRPSQSRSIEHKRGDEECLLMIMTRF